MTAALDDATLYGLTAAQGWSAPSTVDLYGIADGRGFPGTQKCKYGDEPATKRVVWADGRAYVPVCDKHLALARRKLSDVVAVHDIPSPAHAVQVDEDASREVDQLYGIPSGVDEAQPDDGTEEVALYGLVHVDPSGLYAQAAIAHWACNVGEFCRNPLHPGPCKGWKHTLHAVAPGAYHAYEKARVEKANTRRRAKVAALRAQGKPVPKGLLKDITYVPPGAGQAQPGFTAPTPQAAKAVVSNIAGQVKTNVPVRAAQLTDQKLASQAQALHDVVVAIQGSTGATPVTLKTAMATAKATQGPGDKLTDHSQIQTAIAKLVKNVGDRANLSDKERDALHIEIADHIEAGTPGVPKGVQDALAKVPAPMPAVRPGAALRNVNIAQALRALDPASGKTGSERLAAYQNLTPADLQRMSRVDLANLERDLRSLQVGGANGPTTANFVTKLADKIYTDLFGTPAGPTPSVPPPATTAAHVKHAVSVAHRSAPGSGLAKNHLDAYGKVTRAEFDQLPAATQDTIRADLNAAYAKFLDPKRKAAAKGLIDRFAPSSAAAGPGQPNAAQAPSAPVSVAPSAPTAPVPAAPVVHPPGSPEAKVAAHLATMADVSATDGAVKSAYVQARALAWAAADPRALQDQVEAAREQVVKDAGRSDLLRTSMLLEAPAMHPDNTTLFSSPGLRDAVFQVANQPSSSLAGVERLFDTKQAGVKKLPDFAQRAIARARNDAILRMHRDASKDAASRQRTTLNVMFGKGDDRSTYETLDSRQQQILQSWAKDSRDASLSAGPSRMRVALIHQRQLDTMTEKQYPPAQRSLINAVADSSVAGDINTASVALRFIDKGRNGIEYGRLPTAYQGVIEDTLRNHGNLASSYPDSSRQARHALAYIEGRLLAYDEQQMTDAAAVADRSIDRPWLNDQIRGDTYRVLSPSQFSKMDVGDKRAILDDMQVIADTTGGISIDRRFRLQQHRDFLDAAPALSSDQKRAISLADPSRSPVPLDGDIIATLNPLTYPQYRALAPVYREAIDARVTALSVNSPGAYAKLMAQFHSGWTPPHAPAAPVTSTASPKVQEVLDTLYGVHPKAHTTAQQLKAYAGLRTADFQGLQSHEQSTVLGDLSYIVTTSKGGTNAARAQKLIDYFTPPGTPPGQLPSQPVHVPANAVAGQNRYPDPGGKPGLLTQAASKGASGDGFTRRANGSTGPWGKYGAAGIMLRHVDSSGVERYLMIERGPAISDPGKWQFPGGAIDSLETPHQGATRETTEELGFKTGALDSARVHGEHVFSVPAVKTPNGDWKYTTIAATVPTQLQPDLSTHHARAETSDAKWMTLDEIRKLDKNGKLLGPLAGGALERNVVSLYPTGGAATGRPGPVTKKLPRLTGTPGAPKPATAHKPSTGRNLLTDKTAIDKLRQDVKRERVKYDGKTADGRLAAIGAMQGYDDTPTVVTKSEMDRLLATGDYIEVWRGVRGGGGKSAAQINEDMRSGPAYYGRGVFGNGYYLAGQKSVARQYSDVTRNSILRILIPKAAVIDTHEKMATEAASIATPHSQAKGGRFESGTLYDVGRYAAAKGVDGVRIDPIGYQGARGMSSHHVSKKGQEAYNWLNRSVLIIQEAE